MACWNSVPISKSLSTKLKPKQCASVLTNLSMYISTGNQSNKCRHQLQNQDIFSDYYQVISDKSRKAAFSMEKKLKCIQHLPPSIMFDMFDTLVRPILTYGSDVWGMSKAGLDVLDKVFLYYARCTLGVKATTCNVIIYGKCGIYPPSVFCQTDVLCYLHRLLTMSDRKLVKSVFCTLNALHNQGFPTWVTKAYDLAETYDTDMDGSATLSPKHWLISQFYFVISDKAFCIKEHVIGKTMVYNRHH